MKSIIFNQHRVNYALKNKKGMFRVVVRKTKNEIENYSLPDKCGIELLLSEAPFEVGETIFVKEAFAYIQDPNECAKENEPCEIHYKADYDAERLDKHDIKAIGTEFLPASRMPQWASRLTLRIKSVKVERLADINEEDAYKSGEWTGTADDLDFRGAFKHWWNATHKKPEEKWEASPWVWKVEMEVVK